MKVTNKNVSTVISHYRLLWRGCQQVSEIQIVWKVENQGPDYQNYLWHLSEQLCRNWTYGTLAQIMQCTELSPLRFAIFKMP